MFNRRVHNKREKIGESRIKILREKHGGGIERRIIILWYNNTCEWECRTNGSKGGNIWHVSENVEQMDRRVEIPGEKD